jgi:CRP-like cAMP-binding protein
MPVYVIVKGRVVWHQGREILLSIGEKELIGELLVVDQDMDSKEATAVDDTLLYNLNKEKFYQIMARYPKLVQNFIQTIHDRASLDLAGVEEEYNPHSNAG